MYDFLGYLTLALIPGFIAFDLVYRKRRYETPRYWRLYALAVTVGIFFFTGWIAGLVRRILAGQGTIADLDLIPVVAKQMVGNTICPLADADAAPMIAYVTKYRAEWEAFIRSGKRLLEPSTEPAPVATRPGMPKPGERIPIAVG